MAENQFHPVSFLADYLHYNSGNECQEGYHIWAGIYAAATQLCRRVWIPFEYFDIYPNLYIALIGKQGNRKSTAKDICRDLVAEVYPELPMSASVASREAICQTLGKNETLRSYKDHTGALIEHRPFAMFINELKNFISIDPQKMVDFLTDIYDRKYYDVSTKNMGSDIIYNPCINMLACETTSWIIDRMKEGLITGGFSRRLIYVHEFGERRRIPFPSIPEGGQAAWNRVKLSLRRMQAYAGPFTWSDEGKEWYSDWYSNMKPSAVPIVADFHESKHIQMLKIAMTLALADTGERILTKNILQTSVEIVDSIEPGMKEIGLAVGRNTLVAPTIDALHAVRSNIFTLQGSPIPGVMLESELRRRMFTHMNAMEIDNTLKHLVGTEQLALFRLRVSEGVEKTFVGIPSIVAQLMAARTSLPATLAASSPQPPSQPVGGTSLGSAAKADPPPSPS